MTDQTAGTQALAGRGRMSLLLLFVVIVAIALVVSHELRVIDRANHSSDDLAERQRRVRIEMDR